MSDKAKVAPDPQVLHIIDAAVSLKEAGQSTKAIELLLQAQDLSADYAPIHMLLGLAYLEAGRPDEAEARLRRALELDPRQRPALQGLGLLSAEKGQHEEAVALLRRHLALRPGDRVTLRALSNELYLLGRAEEGLDLLREAWQRAETASGGVLLGRYLTRLRRPAEAEVVFRRVAEITDGPGPLVNWGYSLINADRVEEAIAPLRRAAEVDPSSGMAWRALAECYLARAEYHEALSAAERALTLDAQDPRNWWPKAAALLSLGRWDQAAEAARLGSRCPTTRPAGRRILAELGVFESEALLRMGRLNEALERLEQLGPQAPNSAAVELTRADVLNRLGRPADTLRVLEHAEVDGTRRDDRAMTIRYESLLLLDRPADAWMHVEPWIASDPTTNVDLLSDVGVALYRAGHIDRAKKAFEQLTQSAPGAARPTSDLGFVLLGYEDWTGARRLFDWRVRAARARAN